MSRKWTALSVSRRGQVFASLRVDWRQGLCLETEILSATAKKLKVADGKVTTRKDKQNVFKNSRNAKCGSVPRFYIPVAPYREWIDAVVIGRHRQWDGRFNKDRYSKNFIQRDGEKWTLIFGENVLK